MPVSTPPETRGARPFSEDELREIRREFPILETRVGDAPLVYLDNAATTQKPLAVLDALQNYYRTSNANVHRGMHELSRRATEGFEAARETVARWVNAPHPHEIIWTRGTTEAINLVACSWGDANITEGDEILLTEMEHHSNLVPWQMLAQRKGAALRYLAVDDEGQLVLDDLPGILASGRVRLAAVTHISNALGTLNPIRRIADAVHAAGALLLVDGAQGAAHAPVDVQAQGADFYALSGHKLAGPTGIGALWVRGEILAGMPPWQGGGEMIREVERDFSTWADLPHKFEAGTPNIAGAIGLAAALDYLRSLGPERILAHEQALMTASLDRLRDFPGMRIFGPVDVQRRAGVLSFTLEQAHPHDISTILDNRGVAIRAGHHCTQLLMKRYGVPATARASFYLYNTLDEVDRLVGALHTVQDIFGDL
jgi:cysteine desulfurase/selenocysteine lyase